MAELEILNSTERYAAEHKGARQRALALLALQEHHELFKSPIEIAEAVRQMDKKTARRFCEGVQAAVKALQTIEGYSAHAVGANGGGEASNSTSEAPEELYVEAATTPEPNAEILESEEPAETDEEVIVEQVLSKYMQRFVSDVTGEESSTLSPDDIARIVEYIQNNNLIPTPRTREDGSRIDSAVYLQTLFAVNGDLKRFATLQETNEPAVRQWFLRIRQRAKAQRKVEKTVVQQADVEEAQPEEVTPVDLAVSAYERDLEKRELGHALLGEKWAYHMGFTSTEMVGLATLLDPKSRGGLSENKKAVMEKVKDLLVTEDGRLVGIDTIDRSKLAKVWQLFGIARDSATGRAATRLPRLLSDIVQQNPREADEFVTSVYEGMHELLELLRTAEHDDAEETMVESELQPVKPVLQVSFDGAKPSLARR